ncbi:hypothetical protein ACFQU2_06740 [Siccirubricoccus deserti]
MIAPIFAETASEVHYVKNLALNLELIEFGNLDHLVVLVPERYLSRVHKSNVPIDKLNGWYQRLTGPKD